MSEFIHLDATAQAHAIANGDISPTEAVDAAITQAQKVNPQLNAIIHEQFDTARAQAKGSLPDGPFRGVPMVLKDLGAAQAGEKYHMGSRMLKNADFRAPFDSYLTERFRRAGFVVIGRTNTPEFGSTITTEPLAYGPARNPYDTDHSTGGSSGGSAASVASHIVSVGHANDGGGSIRIPASECGLVGLKPSRGRISQGPYFGENWMGATIDGCVTRTVRDTAAVLDEICGYESGDPYTAPPFARPLVRELCESPGRLRIGLMDSPGSLGGLDHAESRASIAATAKILESLGHEVVAAKPAALDETEYSQRFTNIVSACTDADLTYFESVLGRSLTDEDIEPDNLFMREIGKSISAAAYIADVQWMHSWTRRMVEWWLPRDGSRGFDMLCTPTIAGPPPKIGHLSGPDGMMHMLEVLVYTAQFNVTGQPAISLPLHWSTTGLPMGVQFVGAPYREDVLVRLASQLEEAMPWRDKLPRVM